MNDFQRALILETESARADVGRQMVWDLRVPLFASRKQVDAAFVLPPFTDKQVDAYLAALPEPEN